MYYFCEFLACQWINNSCKFGYFSRKNVSNYIFLYLFCWLFPCLNNSLIFESGLMKWRIKTSETNKMADRVLSWFCCHIFTHQFQFGLFLFLFFKVFIICFCCIISLEQNFYHYFWYLISIFILIFSLRVVKLSNAWFHWELLIAMNLKFVKWICFS